MWRRTKRTVWGDRPFALARLIRDGKYIQPLPEGRPVIPGESVSETGLLLYVTTGDWENSTAQSLSASTRVRRGEGGCRAVRRVSACVAPRSRIDTRIKRTRASGRAEARVVVSKSSRSTRVLGAGQAGQPPVLSAFIRPSNACCSCSSGIMIVGFTSTSRTKSSRVFDRLV